MQLRFGSFLKIVENSVMTRGLFILPLILQFCVMTWAQSSNDVVFEKKKLEERYVDYYTRRVLDQKYLSERDRGAQEVATERLRQAEEYERFRKQFVLERRQKKEFDSRLHEQELLERKKAHEKSREEYARKMLELKKVKKEFEIPGEEELGLNIRNENL